MRVQSVLIKQESMHNLNSFFFFSSGSLQFKLHNSSLRGTGMLLRQFVEREKEHKRGKITAIFSRASVRPSALDGSVCSSPGDCVGVKLSVPDQFTHAPANSPRVNRGSKKKNLQTSELCSFRSHPLAPPSEVQSRDTTVQLIPLHTEAWDPCSSSADKVRAGTSSLWCRGVKSKPGLGFNPSCLSLAVRGGRVGQHRGTKTARY